MPFPLRFHVLTLPGRPWSEFREQVLHIEQLGFDVAAIPDHFVDWANPPAPWLECWTLMAAIAAETTTVRLATNVAQIPLRHPGILAHHAATVDQISGGRVEVGIGTGLRIDPGTEMLGLPNWSNGERVDRFGEYVELLGLLLGQEVTDYTGTYYSANGAVMNPTSTQRPRIPIIVAALGPRMLVHAVRHADTWNTMSFDADFDVQLDELARRAASVDDLCAEVGRDPATLRRSANLFDATARASGGRLRYLDDEDLFVRLVRSLVATGFTDVGIYYPTDAGQVAAFERIATTVVPSLRAETADLSSP